METKKLLTKRSKPFVFDDTNLPLNNLTSERSAEIEKLAMPLLEEAFEKLRREQPELFKRNSDKQ